MAYQIVVAERGWIYAGDVSRDGDMVVISRCFNIRRWGTTKGLGELAFEGPRDETQLDPYGTVRIHVLAVCGSLDVGDNAASAFDRKWEESTGNEPSKSRKK